MLVPTRRHIRNNYTIMCFLRGPQGTLIHWDRTQNQTFGLGVGMKGLKETSVGDPGQTWGNG